MGAFYSLSGMLSTSIAIMEKDVPGGALPAFASWLARELKRSDMNQREFAKALGVSTSTVSRWLSGRTPEAPYCDVIADVLRVDVDTVLTIAGYRPATEPLRGDDPRTRIIALVKRADLSAPGVADGLEAMLRELVPKARG